MKLDLSEAADVLYERLRDADVAAPGLDFIAERALLAAVPIIERQVRAEVAEGIARAIEAEMRRDKHGVSAWVYGWQDGLNDAAAIARGYTHGQDPADS